MQLQNIRMKDVFAHELARALRLGYTCQVSIDDPVVTVRLVPKTQRALHVAGENRASAIESTRIMGGRTELMDTIRDCLEASLRLAGDAAA